VVAARTENFSVTITAPRPLTITNTNPLQGVAVGQSYDILLTADGGLPGYTWTLKGGTLPPGLLVSSHGHLAGHPTTRGTYSFTLRVTDSRRTSSDRTYQLTVS
jgi:hypothetical protein